ncbi:hypothetical protein EVAR_75538_1 [Eumeta japonica]|uniref:Uncharacterized protein n=1 Tax=Eumeta variegata TaxID=151549 RepID=A0A4C1UKB1_EUMVA|nr:hypothetical protein EVAR_75538_1 [Eumeta japonica]
MRMQIFKLMRKFRNYEYGYEYRQYDWLKMQCGNSFHLILMEWLYQDLRELAKYWIKLKAKWTNTRAYLADDTVLCLRENYFRAITSRLHRAIEYWSRNSPIIAIFDGQQSGALRAPPTSSPEGPARAEDHVTSVKAANNFTVTVNSTVAVKPLGYVTGSKLRDSGNAVPIGGTGETAASGTTLVRRAGGEGDADFGFFGSGDSNGHHAGDTWRGQEERHCPPIVSSSSRRSSVSTSFVM